MIELLGWDCTIPRSDTFLVFGSKSSEDASTGAVIARLRSSIELNSVPFGESEMNCSATELMTSDTITPKAMSSSLAFTESAGEGAYSD